MNWFDFFTGYTLGAATVLGMFAVWWANKKVEETLTDLEEM